MKISEYLKSTVLATALIVAFAGSAAAEPDATSTVSITKRYRLPFQTQLLNDLPKEDKSAVTIRNSTENWKPAETAIIVCDMWTQHGCTHATARLRELAPAVNDVITAAREKGILIIHAPSGGMGYYPNSLPARKTAEKFRKGMGDSQHWPNWEHTSPSEKGIPFPVDSRDGGCPDCKGGKNNYKETDLLTIKDTDVLTDDFVEIKDYTKFKGIKNIIIMGVHTNMCIIGRPFGLRAMRKAGYNTVLMRDMT
ncbi:MAG: cysteine hydrolase, partial [Puniceicoccales bacterium]|nr:cysteine hydrolase [Puniceicoccales bacterium]